MKTFILNGMKLGAEWFIASMTMWIGAVALFGSLFLAAKGLFALVGVFGKKKSDVAEVEGDLGPTPAAVPNESVA